MHELALCRSITGIVERARDGRAVSLVSLDVGELRQVVPETLTHCWDVAIRGTALAGSRLQVTLIPAVIECQKCGNSTQLEDVPMMVCPNCGSIDTVVVSGEEFLVRSIDVKE